jgi:hypothetical protein
VVEVEERLGALITGTPVPENVSFPCDPAGVFEHVEGMGDVRVLAAHKGGNRAAGAVALGDRRKAASRAMLIGW